MLLIVPLIVSASESVPFWKAKEKAYARVKKGEIVVAVKSRKNRMITQGGGQVDAPSAFVFAQASNFDEVSKVSGYIRASKYDAKTGVVDLTIAAYGFEGKMRVRTELRPEGEPKRINFKVIGGALEGLTGHFTFADVGPRKTEVGIESDFTYDQFPAPQIFLEFGLEVIFQRMAARLKAHVEERFRERRTK